ncbi:MAG: FKBP-type peptidyl-prolyl cis-trans isomerase [Candidatus Nitrohelix vancouverensis]|uniref:Peptidyl-prolyl cis-trans isomerase n=1 Tax=Candidatus Nitrohelix vancouverensis TaxID=2705534 RepID=A0A7T0C5K7_9BACT|nr:MAG: FKBP-type peptidyl-prolyl cis-trans isomerase [Candidatus Nitrohelix vancouverensis]
MKSKEDITSYSLGLDIAKGIQDLAKDTNLNPEIILKGFADGMDDKKDLLSEEEARQALAEFQKQMQAIERKRQQEEMARMEEEMKKQGEVNKKAGEAFLKANKSKSGVKTLPSGLQYQVIKAGTGKTPTAADQVETHYRGTLIDGSEFDSSHKRNKTVVFPVNGVISGWTEALQLMKEGGQWRLFIPPQLAYGERGAGGIIGPNATLIFDIELIAVK